MSNSDIETVRRIYDAFARRDLDAIRAAIAADAVIEQSSVLPWGGRHIGPDGLAAFLGTLLSHVDPTLEVDQIFDAGDAIIQARPHTWSSSRARQPIPGHRATHLAAQGRGSDVLPSLDRRAGDAGRPRRHDCRKRKLIASRTIQSRIDNNSIRTAL
ncbi:nuclear transport factor 2 family protein [Nonomuraea sp. K274]|uniref:Nuclear transport factor 2 family protein n=1 Tax=Nonomuraea cypriaca TaxID=1187855 RepID=A0A931EVM2_9ACTN|nr:nuclear transport factor 2 family protein [Nonomuraea cypriaca]MBF8184310.1 nuclear transport factor 2 family protein [Nonomuraea cypriaca]